MRVLLDSNAYSNLKRGHPRVVELIRGSEEIYLSTIVVGELLFGFRMGSRFDRNVRELHAFLDSPYVTLVPVSLNTADRYSRIAASLRLKGFPIPSNDIWIAAQAMETGADLISCDRHFDHVAGLAWVHVPIDSTGTSDPQDKT